MRSALEHLPPFLQRRTRMHASSPEIRTEANSAAPVVYWMRVAVRDHENPALDVALAIAEAEQRPVLVYHALSERYPYASDRHHTFILEGARDVAAAFLARGIPYAFHLERPESREAVLANLAKSARVVVTELMPVEPLRGWTQAVAKLAPVLEVDASCIFPMIGSLQKAPTRAFEFRKSAAKAQSQLLEEGYPVFPFASRKDWLKLPELPFQPIALETASIPNLLRDLSIDHSVAPVPDSQGGSIAGYARWSQYLKGDLARYASTRNDPLLDTTSRMSAYLHYGHVSPFRLAGDLYRFIKVNPGAEKLLDEMLIWRELAWHFCYHTETPHAVQSLPGWALETLKEHEADERTALPSWEQLAHANTGDELWDACQRSLLAHGELHNNVRMTWGKKLLEWTASAGEALSLLLDLNHRYALDGRDPASYAGIQWCFGAFDRPFTPASHTLGTVRPRPLNEDRGWRLSDQELQVLLPRVRCAITILKSWCSIRGGGQVGGWFPANLWAYRSTTARNILPPSTMAFGSWSNRWFGKAFSMCGSRESLQCSTVQCKLQTRKLWPFPGTWQAPAFQR
jgi:photolyase PhrII